MIPMTPAEIDGPEEPRRVEADAAFEIDDEPELSKWADEHGYVFTPGNWPVGGAL